LLSAIFPAACRSEIAGRPRSRRCVEFNIRNVGDSLRSDQKAAV
jgi:hypothetical protein